jgi:hypothetical protein
MAETNLTDETTAHTNGSLELGRLNGAVTSEVDEFCRKHNLFDAVAVYTRHAEKHFHLAAPPALEVHIDPETGESWVVVDVRARGTLDEVFAAYERCLRELIQIVSLDSRRKIILSYGVASA